MARGGLEPRVVEEILVVHRVMLDPRSEQSASVSASSPRHGIRLQTLLGVSDQGRRVPVRLGHAGLLLGISTSHQQVFVECSSRVQILGPIPSLRHELLRWCCVVFVGEGLRGRARSRLLGLSTAQSLSDGLVLRATPKRLLIVVLLSSEDLASSRAGVRSARLASDGLKLVLICRQYRLFKDLCLRLAQRDDGVAVSTGRV